MNIIITGRKVALKDSFKELVERKLSRFDRMFNDEAHAAVTVTVEKNRETVEITIKHSGLVYRAEDTSLSMFDSLDKVLESLGRQFRKHKSKLEKRLRNCYIQEHLSFDADDVEEDDYKIVRTKRFPVKPLDLDEAILQMNMVGHQFFMFRNQDTDEVNVVYRRKNGSYGVLEPEAM